MQARMDVSWLQALYPDALHPYANAMYTILTDIAFIVGRKPGKCERGAH